MKKIILLAIVCLMGISLIGCAERNPGNDSLSTTSGDITSSSETVLSDTDTETATEKETVTETQTVTETEVDTNTNIDEITYSEDFDGVVLTVTLDKSTYSLDSIIYITATVKNNTDETIALFFAFVGAGSEGEIETIITKDNNNYLIDIDRFNEGFDDACSSKIIEPGEEYVQNMRFETYTGDDEKSRKIASEGVYAGITTIKLLSDPDDLSSSKLTHTLNFELEIK